MKKPSIRTALLGVAGAAALAFAALPAAAGAEPQLVPVCTSATSFAPVFVAQSDTAYLHEAPAPVAYPWLFNDDTKVPVAIPTAKLGDQFQSGRLATEAGDYTLVCNPLLLTTKVEATSMYVDNSGMQVPGIYPYIDNGKPIPGTHRVYAAAG
jgi:hypothetical protein